MRRALAIVVVLLVVLVVSGFGWTVWPTPYRQLGTLRGQPVREHRVSQRVEVLSDTGWADLHAVTRRRELDSLAIQSWPTDR